MDTKEKCTKDRPEIKDASAAKSAAIGQKARGAFCLRIINEFCAEVIEA